MEKNEKKVEKTDLQDVLNLVKEKLTRDVEGGCGIFWPDSPLDDGPVTTRYAVSEEG